MHQGTRHCASLQHRTQEAAFRAVVLNRRVGALQTTESPVSWCGMAWNPKGNELVTLDGSGMLIIIDSFLARE